MSVLQHGGNAFDAAIAVAAAEGVLLPMMCGLGGDAFALLFASKQGDLVAFNGSGVAAAGATCEYYNSRGLTKMPTEGVQSVSVPGAVSLYESIWQRYGSQPWADLWAPAVALAEDGVAITEHVSQLIADHSELLRRYEHSAAQFLVNRRPPVAGERWAAPNLAASLRAIAKGGAETFYRGELAEKLLSFLSREGALFAADDFARHETVVYKPIATDYRGVTVYETAPPSQGFLVLQQLNVLEGFDLAQFDPFSSDRIHMFVEANKLAFADLNRYAGDPMCVRWPLDQLISKEYAQRQRAVMGFGRAGRAAGALPNDQAGSTSYFAIADRDGNAVSFIHSLASYFGSGVVAGETGITLNNRAGRGFRLQPDHPNVIQPGKRTINTLNCYMLCRDGKPWLAGGTPGGDQQPQWNVQTITNLLDYGMSLQEAVEAPRWFNVPGVDLANREQSTIVRLEQRVPQSTRRELTERGYLVEMLGPWSGGGAVQLVQVDHAHGVLIGASDPRAGGLALGL
jgi:gamma-glutamyltranspeptidase/glutathione hydrolase